MDWVLAGAFGSGELPTLGIEDLSFDAPSVERLPGDLMFRLAHRVRPGDIEAVIGPEELAALLRHRWKRAARALRHEQLGRELGEKAAELGAEVVFLKGLALHLAGYTAAGTRTAADIDLLARPEQARQLHEALTGAGWRASDVGRKPQHLPPLTRPDGSVVEIHLHLRGVSLDGRQAHATADRVFSAQLTRPVAELGEACHVPERDLLAAHLLAHGIGQHGTAPQGYPLIRLLADLQDLGFGSDRRLPERVLGWIAASVSRQEAEGLVQVLAHLESGKRASVIAAGDDAAAQMLRHILATRLDDDYALALKLRPPRSGVGRGAAVRGLGQQLLRAVWLTREQMDAVYGPPRSPLGYWGLRLVRPFDLLGRAARSSAAWWRVRRRSR